LRFREYTSCSVALQEETGKIPQKEEYLSKSLEQLGKSRFGTPIHVCTFSFQTVWSGTMLGYALIFLLLALVAGYLGFFGLAGLAASIAKILLVVFVILLIVSAFSGAVRGRRPI
jgi:uncharacterized membrane protein YtjA (UPF0391 family)